MKNSVRSLLVLAGLVAGLGLAGCTSRPPQPAPSPQPAQTATPFPVLTPPPPYATPTPLVTPPPSPYHFVFAPTPAPGAATPAPDAPAILEVDLTDQAISAPGPFNIRVLTSPPVSAVTIRALGRTIELPKTATGQFSVDSQLPSLPFWLKGKTFAVDFVASVPDGRTAKVTIPVTLR